MLYRFHRILIACGIVFSFGFAAYELLRAHPEGSHANWIMAGIFVLGGAGLAAYLRTIRRDGIRS